MDLLRLLVARDLAGPDRPDGLVGHDDLAPVLHLLGHRTQLRGHDVDGLVCFPLLQRLAAAEDHANAAVQRGFRLLGHEVVTLLQYHPPLAVPEERPGDVGVFQLCDTDLAREGAVRLVEDVLRRYFDAWAEMFAGEEEVEGWRGDDDFGIGRALGVVEVGDDGFDGVDGAVHLEVAADEELAGHGGGVEVGDMAACLRVVVVVWVLVGVGGERGCFCGRETEELKELFSELRFRKMRGRGAQQRRHNAVCRPCLEIVLMDHPEQSTKESVNRDGAQESFLT